MAESNGGSRRIRSDGFDGERKGLFLVALRRGLPVLAACALVGVSNRTAYNHRRDDPAFARDWALARRMYALPLELAAFSRAVDGVEEPVYAYGKVVGVRKRRSDGLLAALLAAEDPERFGRSASACAQAKLVRRIKRLARRLKAVEARLEAEQSRTIRNQDSVNFMKVSPRRSPSARKPVGWRLAAARRRAPVVEIVRVRSKS